MIDYSLATPDGAVWLFAGIYLALHWFVAGPLRRIFPEEETHPFILRRFIAWRQAIGTVLVLLGLLSFTRARGLLL